MTDDSKILLSFNLLENVTEKEYFKYLYCLSNNYINNYKIIKVKKKNGKMRTIYVPAYALKKVQRKILHNVLEKYELSVYAKAYRKGISLIDNAKGHLNKKVILKLDIYKFFDNISFEEVYGVFRKKYSKNVSVLLANLCTYAGFLPQGTPTAAYLSNLVLKDFDYLVGQWCEEKNIVFTRYSDDMTFSGDFDIKDLITFLKSALSKYGFRLNYDKIFVIAKHKKQKVTGLVVNKKINVEKEYRKKIRQEIYYIQRFGLKDHLRILGFKDKEKYLNSLRGRINFVYFVTKSKEFLEYRDYVNGLKG